MRLKPFVLSVKVLIFDDDERCLVIRRSASSKSNAGKWDLPGGKIDEGETFDAALLREAMEETGLAIALESVAGAAESETPDRKVAYIIMRGRVVGGEVRISQEHDRFAWVLKNELSRIDLCSQFKSFLNSVLDT